MKHNQLVIIVAALFGASVVGGMAATTVLTFEGLGNNEAISNYYNGGLGGNGSGPGPNYGVTFSSNALALIDADAPGGTGNFGGEPSPSTTMYFLSGAAATLNYAAGFTTGFSFFYTAINQPGFINVYDDVNGTGNLLASLSLPLTPNSGAPDPTGAFSPFLPIGVSFQGIAKSVDFGGAVDQIGFDNITFGSDTPGGVVPEPGNFAAVGCVLVSGLLLRNRRQRRINA
ncbi:MAG: hypothetical protein MUF04_12640 [Akkermansiaceae bacterium]|jgi:hypothetical protein|nr:hypothetical protein [Akkermansiaceae bacterium]